MRRDALLAACIVWAGCRRPSLPDDAPTVFATVGPDGAATHEGGVIALGDALAAGVHMACAVTDDGRVRCWGGSTTDETADRTERSYAMPTPLVGLDGVTEVAVGSSHACARLRTGRVRCWGENTFGQLGDGTTRDSAHPVDVVGIEHAAQLGLGRWFSCARLDDGTVSCWGANGHGQLGRGTRVASVRPVGVEGLSRARDLDVRGDHACVVDAIGVVRCWGSAIGEDGDDDHPRRVEGVHDAVEVEVGRRFACVRTSTASVACWGANDVGQLGREGNEGSNTPEVITMISNAVLLEVGDDHACVRTRDGRLSCWGGGVTPGRGNSARPVIIEASPEDIGLAAGRRFTCAARRPTMFGIFRRATDVRCWGDNTSAQLGHVTLPASDRPSPVTIDPRIPAAEPTVRRPGFIAATSRRTSASDTSAIAAANATCARMPEILGAPLSRTISCRSVNRELGIFAVALVGPDASEHDREQWILVSGERRVTGRGGADLLRFMRERRIYSVDQLDLTTAVALLEVFDAFPPGFNAESRHFHEHAVAYSYFLRNPFTLVLVTRGANIPESALAGSRPAYVRVMLHGNDGFMFFWEFEHQDTMYGPWRVADRYALERAHPGRAARP